MIRSPIHLPIRGPRRAPASPHFGVDPHWSKVVFLAGFDGADGATSAVDESTRGHELIFTGDAQLDTAQPRFGSAALLLDGSGDVTTAADSDDWWFGSGPYTVEAWFRWSADPEAAQFLLAQWPGATGRSWALWYSGSTNQLIWSRSTTGTDAFNDIAATWTPTLNQYYHIAVDYDLTKTRLYVDGAMVGSSTTKRTLFNAATALSIGAIPGATSPFAGHVDEVRITRGAARYATDGGFALPSAPFPRS